MGKGKSRLATEMTWLGFCKKIGLGKGSEPSLARLCMLVGAVSPKGALMKLDRELAHGRISPEDHGMFVHAVEVIKELFVRPADFFKAPKDKDDWQDLGHGGYMRKIHLGM